MELKKKSDSFLGKKIKKSHDDEDNIKSKEIDKTSSLLETSAEISSDNLISLEEKSEFKEKIPGFDDLKIPGFLNDFKCNKKIDKSIEEYYKIKEELGSPELAELYLIDINRLFEEKKKSF